MEGSSSSSDDSSDEDYTGDQNSEESDTSSTDSSSGFDAKETQTELVDLEQQLLTLVAEIDKLKCELIVTNKNLVRKEAQIRHLRTKINSMTEISREIVDEMRDYSIGNKKSSEDILPKLLWKLILSKLSDPKDLLSCGRTCQLFNKILYPDQSWLFAEQIFHHLFNFLSKRDVLQLRLVCKQWKHGVDNFLELPQCLIPHNDNVHFPLRPPFLHPMREKDFASDLYSLTNWEFNMASDLLRHMRGHNSPNPIIGRSLIAIEHDWLVDHKVFWKRLYAFLRKVNKSSVWHLLLSFRKSFSEVGVQKALQFLTVDIFNLIPELRALRITGKFHMNADTVIDIGALPSAKKLEVLQLDEPAFTATNPLFDALLIRYHYQLGRLHVNIKTWKCASHLEWPQLKELHLQQIDIRTEADVNSLVLANLPQLRKLGLSICYQYHSTLDALLEIINKVSARSPLNILRLHGGLSNQYVAKSEKNLFASSNITTVEWEHCGMNESISCYSLLLRFPFLENLNVYWTKPIDNTTDPMECYEDGEIELRSGYKRQWEENYYFTHSDEDYREMEEDWNVELDAEVVEVNKYVYDGNMYKSNVWEILPRLKVFTFQKRGWTREGYEG